MRTSKIQNGQLGPQNGRRGLKSGLPQGFWALPSTFAKWVFDTSTPSMWKGDDRGEEKKIVKIVATNVVAS